MRKLFYHEVVIGCRLDAVIYAFCHDLPLLLITPKKPSHIEYFSPMVLPVIGDFPSRVLTLKEGHLTVGPNKLEVWNRLCFLMSLRGRIPFGDKISFIRVDEEGKQLKIITKNSRSIIIQCTQAIVFDDKNINGLPVPVRIPGDNVTRRVVDWIDVRSGMVHPYDILQTDSTFVNSVHFYPSTRIDGNHDKKDLAAVSYLTRAELNDIEYSDLLVRYKVLDMMKTAGIRGRKNGRHPVHVGKHKHYAIKLEMNKREVDLREKTLYNNTQFVKFMYKDDDQLLNEIGEIPPSVCSLYDRITGRD